MDQKERYSRQAALCYAIAGTMSGESAASMMRVADTYAALAEDHCAVVPPAIYVAPCCVNCGKKLRPTHSLQGTDTIIQAVQCDGCGKTMIWNAN
jgi:hypothetical protein